MDEIDLQKYMLFMLRKEYDKERKEFEKDAAYYNPYISFDEWLRFNELIKPD